MNKNYNEQNKNKILFLCKEINNNLDQKVLIAQIKRAISDFQLLEVKLEKEKGNSFIEVCKKYKGFNINIKQESFSMLFKSILVEIIKKKENYYIKNNRVQVYLQNDKNMYLMPLCSLDLSNKENLKEILKTLKKEERENKKQ